MVHARRKLYELAATSKAPIAAEAVRRIDRLFAVERDINGLSAEARLAVRRERSAPILAELEPWLRQQQERLSRKSEVGKAIAHTTRRWEALTRFMADGRVCLNNNAAERALRGVAVGRRNWTFAGSDRGGERAAAIYTLIESAMCGWPARCKGEDDWLWRVVGGVHVSGLSEAATRTAGLDEIRGSGPDQTDALEAPRAFLGVPISSIDRRVITSISADAPRPPAASTRPALV